MKKFTKLLGIVLIIALVMSMGITAAFAADGETVTNTVLGSNTTFTIKVNIDSSDKAAHTYGAFQLFKGDLAETKDAQGNVTKKVLSNIQWGDSIDSSKVAQLKTDLNAIDGITIATDADAAAVAKAISDANLGADSPEAQAVADAFNKALGSPKSTATVDAVAADSTAARTAEITVPAGYYLVKDTADVSGLGSETRFILEVVSDVTPVEKASVPSVTKKVKEKNDSEAASQTNPTGWQDAADYDIGDTIPYQITGTLPQKFADYDKYTVYTFTDTLGTGLTITADQLAALTVKVNGTTDVTEWFDVAFTSQVLTVSLKEGTDLKTVTYGDSNTKLKASDTIVVEYKATLDDDAVIGTPGNPNEVDLKFSNNPNYDSTGEYGTTPKDKVVVFTYEIKALKVEPDGAGIDATAYNDLTDAQKAEYVQIGTKYFKTKALSGAGFTLFKKDASLTEADANKDSFSEAVSKGDVVKDGSDFYVAVADEITGQTTFEFKGTDAGVYKLVETTVPAGYNKCNDIDITVTATYDTDSADPKLTSLTVTPSDFAAVVTENKTENVVTSIITDGVITGKVVNQSGAVLPSTGGIGTTIFYVVGSILVVAAGVLLITKKRMSRE